MADPAVALTDGELIADRYAVDTKRKLAAVGGQAAFGVVDRAGGRTDLMAIQLDRQYPPRSRALQALATPVEGLLTPVSYGPVGNNCFLLCLAPPGPSVQSRPRPWSEAE